MQDSGALACKECLHFLEDGSRCDGSHCICYHYSRICKHFEKVRTTEMNEYQTGAVRDTGGKGRMDLLPWCAIMRISKHMEDAILPDPETGKPHYPERNWEKGLPIHSMIDSAFRHLAKYVDGWNDEDHLCAAATNLLMAMWMEEKIPNQQDIPTRLHKDPEVATDGCGYFDAGHGKCDKTSNREYCLCNGDERRCDFPNGV